MQIATPSSNGGHNQMPAALNLKAGEIPSSCQTMPLNLHAAVSSAASIQPLNGLKNGLKGYNRWLLLCVLFRPIKLKKFLTLQQRIKEQIVIASHHQHVVCSSLHHALSSLIDDIKPQDGSQRAADKADKAHQWQCNSGADGQRQQDVTFRSADTATGDGD